jgi:hypothetical protein
MTQDSLKDYSGTPDLFVHFREMVAVNAYFKAEKIGFVSGNELEDWLQAEKEITTLYSHWFY